MENPHVTFTLRLPKEVRDRAHTTAAGERMSLNSWFVRLAEVELNKRDKQRMRAAEKGEGQNGGNRLTLGHNPANR